MMSSYFLMLAASFFNTSSIKVRGTLLNNICVGN